LFAAPPEKDLEWNQDGVEGLARFAARMFRLASAQAARVRDATMPMSMQGLDGADACVRRAVHRTLAKVTDEVGVRNHFNTAIASMMELVNTLHEHKLHTGGDIAPGVAREAMLVLAQMVAPFAPHLAEEIWSTCGGVGLVAHSRWPEADPKALSRDTLRIIVQVNGKLRGQLDMAADASEDTIAESARADENVARYLEGKTLRKQIFVPGRLINFVVSG
ncbi:MAG: class I tRNA ligase family protein, partial [Myxococcota bacterium]